MKTGLARKHEPRFYRSLAGGRGLRQFEVAVGETDLQIFAAEDLHERAESLISDARAEIISYAATHRGFYESLSPLDCDTHGIVREMCDAARAFNVGPMAAVAGAMAAFVGRGLLAESDEVIIENGGDIFFHTQTPPVFGLYAGPNSRFTNLKFATPGLLVGGVCTSSGTVGHSLSFGNADAVVIVADDAAYADAAATAFCNQVKSAADVEQVIDRASECEWVKGIIVAIGETLGAWGSIEFIEG